ncbi:Lpg1974 family pore-forming outer membrane protein [Candidatus Rhabdochlamydia sp. W815]|uniref:Lpg1974 family pore-forming outer membrane protein n=1 Tax=Candidatus Rhabdochlamydia sp. W815 TaxID=2720721 RepID=UPI001BFCB1C3|nr:Lpg1974 family pore-forming outer membrane protein [Candidatus Rhabdochlamydia sp. W815]
MKYFILNLCAIPIMTNAGEFHGHLEECCDVLLVKNPETQQNIVVDYLLFRAIEDTLKYGETNFRLIPPPSHDIEQDFSYNPGIRVTLNIPTYDYWLLSGSCTYFRADPSRVTSDDPTGNIFANLVAPTYFSPVNQQVSHLSGKWELKMQIFDVLFKKGLMIGKSFIIEPFFGVQGCTIKQKVDVHYTFFKPRTSLRPPQSVKGISRVSGVGPELGAEFRMVFPYRISLFARGGFSCLLGSFKGHTDYGDLLGCSSSSTQISLKDHKLRLFSSMLLQIALSKWWCTSRSSELELTLGWETQIWSRQMRMNWFSTLASPSEGSDLTLHGPFVRFSLSF